MAHKTAVTLIAAGAIAAGLLMAQGPGFGRWGGGSSANSQNAAGWRLDRMSAMLNLTDSQKQQAKVIFDAAFEASQALEPALIQSQTALQEAAKANHTADIDKLAAAVGAVLGQMRAIDAKAFAQFYNLLTPAQRDQLGQCPGGGMCLGAGLCPNCPGGGMGRMHRP